MSKFGTKNAWFGYFGAGTWKQCCHIWNQHPRICPLQNFAEKQKWDEKWLISVILTKKCLIWVFLSKISRKAIVIFEIGTVKFVYLRNFTKKQKCLNLGPNMPYLGIFDQKCLILIFLTKNVFWGIFGLEF